jgi:hypothetical protein
MQPEPRHSYHLRGDASASVCCARVVGPSLIDVIRVALVKDGCCGASSPSIGAPFEFDEYGDYVVGEGRPRHPFMAVRPIPPSLPAAVPRILRYSSKTGLGEI